MLTVPWVGLQYVIGVFPDHTHLHFKPPCGSSAVRSKAMGLLLLSQCLMFSHCLLGFCVWSLFSYALFNVLSSFAIISACYFYCHPDVF